VRSWIRFDPSILAEGQASPSAERLEELKSLGYL
jgi:hypothetical protein